MQNFAKTRDLKGNFKTFAIQRKLFNIFKMPTLILFRHEVGFPIRYVQNLLYKKPTEKVLNYQPFILMNFLRCICGSMLLVQVFFHAPHA